MTVTPPPIARRDAGFTLVEMLVALLIFAAIASAGVLMLRGSVETQAAIAEHLAQRSTVTRLSAAMTADLAAALPRATRAGGGATLPAFVGDQGSFSVVRGGIVTADDAGPDVQRIAWRLSDGAMARAASRADGGRPGPPALFRAGAATLAVRYRAADGMWHANWPGPPGEPLPRVVETTLTAGGGPPLTIAFLVAPAPVADGVP